MRMANSTDMQSGSVGRFRQHFRQRFTCFDNGIRMLFIKDVQRTLQSLG